MKKQKVLFVRDTLGLKPADHANKAIAQLNAEGKRVLSVSSDSTNNTMLILYEYDD